MVKIVIFALLVVSQSWHTFAYLHLNPNCSSVISMIRDQTLTFNEIISGSYNSDIKNFKTVLNFVQSCPKHERLSGYEAIFNVMNKNNDLWSTEGFELAYTISQIDSTWNLAYKFPETIYKLHFDSNPHCLFKSVEFNEYYYAADSWYGYDSSRRNNYCWVKGTSSAQSVYDVRAESKDVFTLRNTYYDEYLYADEAQFAHSTERRRVFCYRYKQVQPVGDQWKFEPQKGTQNIIKIRNTKYNELLYADRDVHYDSKRREVFTERVKGHAEERWTLWSLEC